MTGFCPHQLRYNATMMHFRGLVAVVGCVGLFLAALASPARACPFCSAVSLTFAQEIAQSEAAVIAKLVESPPAAALGPGAEGPLPKGKFEVVEAIKGGDLVAAAGHIGGGAKPIEAIVLEDKPLGTLFLLMAIEPERLLWSSPIRLSERSVTYIKALGSLPEKGPDRLAFFMKHLEDEDESLARDSYDEFAIAPYEDLKGLADRMDSKKLLGWIEDPKVQANRRRLYATMLGVCGTEDDAKRIADIIAGKGPAAEHSEVRGGLDAMIACYVALEGAKALDLVDELFLKRQGGEKEIPFTETYSAVMALRFLGEESDLVPRERVLQSLRYLLDEPKLADLVIADLARWEDWSVIDRLVTIFKEAKQDNIFVREPIVNYLRACPLPEAAAAVEELATIDPEAVRRAATLAGLAGITAAAPAEGEPPPASPSDTSLVGVIEDVQGDEDPTATKTSTQTMADGPTTDTPSKTTGRGWQWAIWAAIVIAVAVFARAALRPARTPRSSPKP
jgi:hypothetical protein